MIFVWTCVHSPAQNKSPFNVRIRADFAFFNTSLSKFSSTEVLWSLNAFLRPVWGRSSINNLSRTCFWSFYSAWWIQTQRIEWQVSCIVHRNACRGPHRVESEVPVGRSQQIREDITDHRRYHRSHYCTNNRVHNIPSTYNEYVERWVSLNMWLLEIFRSKIKKLWSHLFL